MHAFQLTGMEDATFANDDRSKLTLRFQTDQGLVALAMQAAHLDSLITMLQGIEYAASLMDPAKGQLPGEAGQVRPAIVDLHQIGHGMVNGVPSVMVGLRSGGLFRWFSFEKPKAEALQRDLVAEIPRLQAGPAVQ
jgi:hypothetical protein